MRKYFQQLLSYKYTLFIVILLAGVFFARLHFITANPLAMDEPFSVFHAQMNISDIISELKNGNNPPLYEIILHFWISVFGTSELSVRLPSLIFSILTILFTYSLARKFLNNRIAVLSALLMSLSATHIMFSHEARAYPLLMMLTTISFMIYLTLVNNQYKRKHLILLVFVYALMAYTHYMAFVVIALQSAVLLCFIRSKKELVYKFLLVLLGFAVLYIPNIVILFNRFTDTVALGTWIKPVEDMGIFFDMMRLFTNNNKYAFILISALFLGAAGVAIYLHQLNKWIKRIMLFIIIPGYFLICYSVYFNIPFLWHLTSSPAIIKCFVLSLPLFAVTAIFMKYTKITGGIIIVWFIIPLSIFFLLSYLIPLFIDRYLSFTLPAFYLTIAIAADTLFRKNKTFAIAALIILLPFGLTYQPFVSNNRYIDKMISDVNMVQSQDTKIVLTPFFYNTTFAYHKCPECFAGFNSINNCLAENNIRLVDDSVYMAPYFNDFSNIVLVDAYSAPNSPAKALYEWLNHRLIIQKTFSYPDSSHVYYFSGRIE